MEHIFVEEKTFDKVGFTDNPLQKGEYENCVFSHCNFANSSLAEVRFMECVFVNCNISMVDLSQTVLQDIQFKGCKMLGLHFENCNHFGFAVQFENCLLNHSSFYRVALKKTVFTNSQLHDVDFTESDLTSSIFEHCDLARAVFDRTIVEKVDLRTSHSFSIDPELNKIAKAKFSLSGIVGLVDKYDIEIDPKA